MPVRGIRGATTAARNDSESIVEATSELLKAMVESNGVDLEEVAFAYFTTTPDLNAEFPAYAARLMGWGDVPLLCGHDMNVSTSNPRGVASCIRILLLYNTEQRQKEMNHVYLRGAAALQQDRERTRAQVENEGAVR
ncbi:MAG TPA: chorismate mutase [Candidatus Dormibacteraeota bacterium]|nr:chorismate mutase [Candidatus Dormibacteraeota bacterium]